MNDGGVDVEGRFWFGSMRRYIAYATIDHEGPGPRAPTPTRLSPPWSPQYGTGWSPDNSTAYFADTKKGTIFIYQFDASTVPRDVHQPQPNPRKVRPRLA